ncbi:hypothetical protein GKQ77_01735 [Streptomyces sp. BG9H]|uniref:Uncharacterized protein n=1 Tax=Streptomyces anatolicus TaxID=2675858 RepID=A0ABS6YFW6_9ACTN|nr:hypothetical protein [Streptomyces anatolicus]MBW5420292.1 hypothetical protein [Streptomyces anatolicus]
MTGIGGLILALVCFTPVGLAAGIAIATRGGREPHWLVPLVRVTAVTVAAFCFLLAAVHQLTEALLP